MCMSPLQALIVLSINLPFSAYVLPVYLFTSNRFSYPSTLMIETNVSLFARSKIGQARKYNIELYLIKIINL